MIPSMTSRLLQQRRRRMQQVLHRMHGLISESHTIDCPFRYASIQNLDSWTNGTLRYGVRAGCAPAAACPAPVLAPATGAPLTCSGNGACGADGACVCNPGWGDLGCDKRVMPIAPGAGVVIFKGFLGNT